MLYLFKKVEKVIVVKIFVISSLFEHTTDVHFWMVLQSIGFAKKINFLNIARVNKIYNFNNKTAVIKNIYKSLTSKS